MKGNILIFDKTSIISIDYDMFDVFCFPKDNHEEEAF